MVIGKHLEKPDILPRCQLTKVKNFVVKLHQIFQSSNISSPIITIGAKISRQLLQLAAKFRPNYFNWRQNYSPIRLS
jgi:hypothetical protein